MATFTITTPHLACRRISVVAGTPLQILWSQSSSISSSSSVSGSISIVGISELLLYPSSSPKPPSFAEILLHKLELPTSAVDPPGATSVRIGFVNCGCLSRKAILSGITRYDRHQGWLRACCSLLEARSLYSVLVSIWVDAYGGSRLWNI